jgi:hypothetical protein
VGEKGTHPHNDSDLGDRVGVHGRFHSLGHRARESETDQERERGCLEMDAGDRWTPFI